VVSWPAAVMASSNKFSCLLLAISSSRCFSKTRKCLKNLHRRHSLHNWGTHKRPVT
jgi:hypothetical protein